MQYILYLARLVDLLRWMYRPQVLARHTDVYSLYWSSSFLPFYGIFSLREPTRLLVEAISNAIWLSSLSFSTGCFRSSVAATIALNQSQCYTYLSHSATRILSYSIEKPSYFLVTNR
jgi:hypothetical protein